MIVDADSALILKLWIGGTYLLLHNLLRCVQVQNNLHGYSHPPKMHPRFQAAKPRASAEPLRGPPSVHQTHAHVHGSDAAFPVSQ